MVNREIFLVSPTRGLLRFFELAMEGDFWKAALGSLGRIALGFLLALLLGVVLAYLAHRYIRIRELLAPLALAVRTVPVASFVILAIICFSSSYLAIFISFLIAFPVIYINTLSGLDNVDSNLMEMAQVFRLPSNKILRYIYLPKIYEFLKPACQTAIGMAWKAGVAAEVIGIPKGSIGAKIQQAKVYLETADLVAWTLAVIILSLLTEKLFLLLLDRGFKASQKVVVSAPSPSAPGATAAAGPAAQLVGVSKKFGDEEVIHDFSATFPAGKVTAVMGPSGRGKTTLLRIIAGLETPDSGEVKWSPSNPRKTFIFQEDRLLEHIDGVGNIALINPNLEEAEIIEAMAEVGLEPEKGKPIADYSGGMKRRIALLRALMAKGDVVLLDEPFKGLDSETRAKTAAYLTKATSGKTVILVTHDREDCNLLNTELMQLEKVEKSSSSE